MKTSLSISAYALIAMLVYPHVIQAAATPKVTPPTSSTSATLTPTTTLDSTVESLKKRIENKVQEMSKKSKKIIKGTVTEVSDDTIQVTTSTDDIYTVSIDDTITQVKNTSSTSSEDATLKDIVQGSFVLVTGPIIERQVTANTIYIQTEHIVVQGVITNLNKSSFTLDVLTLDKDTYTIDVEDDTKQVLMDSKTLELAKTGFSKMRIGDTIHAVIEKPAEKNKTARAVRILILPQEFFAGL